MCIFDTNIGMSNMYIRHKTLIRVMCIFDTNIGMSNMYIRH